MDQPKIGPAVWPFPTGTSKPTIPTPIAVGAPGGEWEPPTLTDDVAILIPLGNSEAMKRISKKETIVYVVEIEGLIGCHVISADGSTRPYAERH